MIGGASDCITSDIRSPVFSFPEHRQTLKRCSQCFATQTSVRRWTFTHTQLGAHARRVDERWLDQYRQLWIERKKTEQRQRRLREKARSLGKPESDAPNRIKGHVFAFTGRIVGWPRTRILYPRVERRGGRVAKSIGSAECLVHAELLGGRKTTRKLVKARQMNMPIITEEQFLRLIRRKARNL